MSEKGRKEGRIQLIEVDEEKGGWKQEEDDKKGDTDKRKRVEGGGKKTFINGNSAGMQSRSAGETAVVQFSFGSSSSVK